jgi:WbqC-like protein family
VELKREMIVAIQQPNYFPWVGFFSKIFQSDVFILLDDAQYAKNSYINRTRIKSASGPLWLTVPVKHKSRMGQAINEAEFDLQEANWAKQRRTIEYNYGRAPGFGEVWPHIRPIFSRAWQKLVDLNIQALEVVCHDVLGLGVRFLRSSEMQCQGPKTDRLVALCKAVGGDVYLSGTGAKDYQDEKMFERAGIELRYSSFKHPRYRQEWGGFVEGLSILDLLFNAGGASRRILEESSRSRSLPMSQEAVHQGSGPLQGTSG